MCPCVPVCIAQVCSVFALMLDGKNSQNLMRLAVEFCLRLCHGFNFSYEFAQVLVVHIKI